MTIGRGAPTGEPPYDSLLATHAARFYTVLPFTVHRLAYFGSSHCAFDREREAKIAAGTDVIDFLRDVLADLFLKDCIRIFLLSKIIFQNENE